METYRSGHNEPDSKSGSPQGLVGSNPTVSARGLSRLASRDKPFFCSRRIFLPDEHGPHCRGGLLLGGEIQVCIDICGSGEGAVAKPDLNLFHGDPVAQEKAGAGMPEIMEANFFEPVFLDKPAEMLCHIIWAEKPAALIHADVLEVISAIGLSEQPSIHLLFLLFCQYQLLHRGDEGQRPKAGFGFQHIFANRDEFPTSLRRRP